MAVARSRPWNAARAQPRPARQRSGRVGRRPSPHRRDQRPGVRGRGAPVAGRFGRWRSDFSALLARVLGHDVRGRPIAERLRPAPTDYVVLKPKHSAFFSTTLDLLLRYLRTRTLVIGGFTADRCVLFTASDAYLRDFRVVVPSDGVASLDRGANRLALSQMRTLLDADVRPSRAVILRRPLRARGRAGAA